MNLNTNINKLSIIGTKKLQKLIFLSVSPIIIIALHKFINNIFIKEIKIK